MTLEQEAQQAMKEEVAYKMWEYKRAAEEAYDRELWDEEHAL
jgi:hypothetical protein